MNHIPPFNSIPSPAGYDTICIKLDYKMSEMRICSLSKPLTYSDHLVCMNVNESLFMLWYLSTKERAVQNHSLYTDTQNNPQQPHSSYSPTYPNERSSWEYLGALSCQRCHNSLNGMRFRLISFDSLSSSFFVKSRMFKELLIFCEVQA